MSRNILFLIFGKFYESFWDTWFRDDFGIFRNVFRILDLNPGICLFNIFYFLSPRKYLLLLISFSFSLFPYFLPSSTNHKTFQNSNKLHTLPPTSSLMPLFLSLFHGRPWLAKRNTSPILFTQNPLSSTLIAPPLQIQILYKLFLFLSLFFFLLHFTKELSFTIFLLHLNLNHQLQNTTRSSYPSQTTTAFGLGSYLSSSIISP